VARAGRQVATRRRRPEGRALDSQSSSGAAISSGMKAPKKKPTAAKLRNWRVAIMCSRAQQIGTVATDRQAAEAEAVKLYSDDQCRRLMVWERG
jgi:hypothetical protein